MTKKTLQELADNFALFDDWEERYRYLIDLGRTLPVMDEALKIDDRLVPGCTSRVWMKAEVKGGRFHFIADSDAHIVRGLVALLYAAYEGKTPDEIRQADIAAVFKQIGLDQHLSPNRRSGFFAMVEKINELAQA
ncbi:MAG: SufE family protein [Alphaproteobacteria bacterium]